MACRTCHGRQLVKLDSVPAGDPRASLTAAHKARVLRDDTGSDAHIHYDPGSDAFVVVRTEPTTSTSTRHTAA